MTAVRWTPRARRIGRTLQAIAGGLLFAALIVVCAFAGAYR